MTNPLESSTLSSSDFDACRRLLEVAIANHEVQHIELTKHRDQLEQMERLIASLQSLVVSSSAIESPLTSSQITPEEAEAPINGATLEQSVLKKHLEREQEELKEFRKRLYAAEKEDYRQKRVIDNLRRQLKQLRKERRRGGEVSVSQQSLKCSQQSPQPKTNITPSNVRPFGKLRSNLPHYSPAAQIPPPIHAVLAPSLTPKRSAIAQPFPPAVYLYPSQDVGSTSGASAGGQLQPV
ncbi:hypothetical protein HDU67_006999 [Dinochytrium kinnereticum]|nr:hypothetical protein HDU67_006999 [Dinochytrium kinnereticum]